MWKIYFLFLFFVLCLFFISVKTAEKRRTSTRALKPRSRGRNLPPPRRSCPWSHRCRRSSPRNSTTSSPTHPSPSRYSFHSQTRSPSKALIFSLIPWRSPCRLSRYGRAPGTPASLTASPSRSPSASITSNVSTASRDDQTPCIWVFLCFSPQIGVGFLAGDVIYDALHPSVAPDVVFSSEDDDFDPLGDIASEGEARVSKSSLCDWNSKDPSRLMALVHELRFSILLLWGD